MKKVWQASKRKIDYSSKTLVMGILNITPDSFSDGGEYNSVDVALKKVEKFIEEGVDIIDVGGESTRPKSKRISAAEENDRVIPIVAAIHEWFDIPISIDTSKSEVAKEAVEAGAVIINDISGLKFDDKVAAVAAEHNAGLILMHLRGDFETMHKQMPVKDILLDVSNGFNWSIEKAKSHGVKDEQICLDIGIGFSKTFEQNLELIAKLEMLRNKFKKYPMLIGTSRKSFIGKILDDAPIYERTYGTLATNVISVLNGANIVRVHDVLKTAEALKVVEAIRGEL